jgi:hypothetical protein
MTVMGCALHSRVNDAAATALAFDILMHTAMTFAENRLQNATPYSAKCFSVAVAGFQYVEHSKDDGREMFKAVCLLGLEGNCLKETGCAVSPRSVLENLDQSQKSESTRCYAGIRWNFLT